MRMFRWGLGLAGVAVAGAIVVGALGLAFAQAEDGDLKDLYKQELAERLGVTEEELDSAREEAMNAALEEAVATGVLTQERADAIRNREPGEFRFRHHLFGHHRGGAFKAFGAAADIIGLEPEVLREELSSGKTLAEVGAENGVDRETLKAGIIADVEAHLQASLDAGDLSQEVYDRLIAGLDERVEGLLDGPTGRHLRVPGEPTS